MELNFLKLNELLDSQQSVIAFLENNRLIDSARRCMACDCDCTKIADSSTSDGIIWRCSRCRKKRSIRSDSWFAMTKLPLKTMLQVIYCWVQEMPQDLVRLECGIGSSHTTVDLYSCCRQICYEYLESTGDMLGGEGKVIEVDEAKFGRRKYHRGRRVDGVWVFGIVERGTNASKCCIIVVDKRDEETLLGEIKKFIAPGTIIYSDCWKAYSRLSEHGYTHQSVNHSLHFKDPVTGVHTNSIEGLWNLLRRWMPKFGTTKDNYASYFVEFIYRRRYFSNIEREQRFSLFISHLASIGSIWGSIE
jgi:transposase-like protein